MQTVVVNIVRVTSEAYNLEAYNFVQERIKGTEKASPIYTLLHR